MPVKVYYAHAICIFGSAQEQQELSWIRIAFKDADVVSPSDPKFHWQKATRNIPFFLDLVDTCDTLVFSRLYGEITAGVGQEVNRALEKGKLVYELSDGAVARVTTLVAAISPEATRVLYHKWWGR